MSIVQNRCLSPSLLQEIVNPGLQFPMDDIPSLIESSDFSAYFYNPKKYCDQDDSSCVKNYILLTDSPISEASYWSALSKGNFDISLKLKHPSKHNTFDIHLDEINTKVRSSDACFVLKEKERVVDLTVRKYEITPNDIWENQRSLFHIEIEVNEFDIQDPVFLSLVFEILSSIREEVVKKQNASLHIEGENFNFFSEKLLLMLLLKNPTIEKTVELARKLNLFTPETFEVTCQLICDLLNTKLPEYRDN